MKVLRELAKKLNSQGIKKQVTGLKNQGKTKLHEAIQRGRIAAAGFGLGSAVAGAKAQKVMKGMVKGANKYGKKKYREGLATGLVTGAGITGAGVLGVNAYKKHKDKDNDND